MLGRVLLTIVSEETTDEAIDLFKNDAVGPLRGLKRINGPFWVPAHLSF